MIEKIVEHDDEAMTQYLEGKEVATEKLIQILRSAVIDNKIFPVYCGSALKNKGVQQLLDAVCDFLPSPLDIPPVNGIDPNNEEKEITRTASDDGAGPATRESGYSRKTHSN